MSTPRHQYSRRVCIFRKIAYSLDNLIFDLRESKHPGVSRGMLLQVNGENGAITKVTPRCTHNNETTCRPDFEAAGVSCQHGFRIDCPS